MRTADYTPRWRGAVGHRGGGEGRMMGGLDQRFAAALSVLQTHRLRSLLTTLGITVGVASVIAVVAIVQGVSHSITSSFEVLGVNSLSVSAYTPFEEQMQGRVNRLTLSDYRLLQRNIEGVQSIAPIFAPYGPFGATVSLGAQTAFTRVYAVTPNYIDIYQVFPSPVSYTHLRAHETGRNLV